MRCTMGSRSSVEGDARDAGVGRESAMDKERVCVRMLVTVSGRIRIVAAGGLIVEGGLGKK